MGHRSARHAGRAHQPNSLCESSREVRWPFRLMYAFQSQYFYFSHIWHPPWPRSGDSFAPNQHQAWERPQAIKGAKLINAIVRPRHDCILTVFGQRPYDSNQSSITYISIHPTAQQGRENLRSSSNTSPKLKYSSAPDPYQRAGESTQKEKNFFSNKNKWVLRNDWCDWILWIEVVMKLIVHNTVLHIAWVFLPSICTACIQTAFTCFAKATSRKNHNFSQKQTNVFLIFDNFLF